MDLDKVIKVAASGLSAQTARLQVISQNLANAESTGTIPGAEPYRRKIVTFKSVLDQAAGVQMVKTGPVATAGGDFERHYDPAHPAANAGEAASLNAVTGKADMSEVVTAVTNAEVALQTVTAVRDRVIQAYQDILRMPI